MAGAESGVAKSVAPKAASLKVWCQKVVDANHKVHYLGTHLFVKVPRPGDSIVTFSVFKSSCHLLLPGLTTKR